MKKIKRQMNLMKKITMIYMIKTKKRCDNKINAYQKKMQEQMID